MKKIIYILSAILITFLLIIKFNVSAMSIPNVSEIRIFNLAWYEIPGGTSDTQYYDLVVEVEPGIYDGINEVIIGEAETLSLYGVLVFQYPRSLSTPLDNKCIKFYPLSGSPFTYTNVDFMAVKKFSNKLELYINNDTYTYQPYNTRIEGFRAEYIADWDYQDGYNDGYNIGYQEGREAGYNAGSETGYEHGYIVGYDEGWEEGNEIGYNGGYQEGHEAGYQEGHEAGYNIGYNAGINEQLDDKDFTVLLKSVFLAIGTFLGINLIPGISIGAIISVPIVFGIIAFIIGKRKD